MNIINNKIIFVSNEQWQEKGLQLKLAAAYFKLKFSAIVDFSTMDSSA